MGRGSRAWLGLGAVAITLSAACSSEDDASEPGSAGALVATRLESQVGVLLDELPAATRDQVAEQLLEQPEANWLARARAQIALTTYRLVFRDFFYDEGEGKGQLPLPPPELWNVELTSAPQRVTVSGHDLVVVGYRFTSTLLAPEDSPGLAEPALAEPGGSWDESFVLPLDPELLFQRTGYACLDESEFPPNSADGENVATFFDDQCEGGPSDCHVTEVPEESCYEALERAVGTVNVMLHFERLGWDEELASQVRVGEVTNSSGADLEVIGEGLENQRLIYRYIAADSCAVVEGCVDGTGWRRLLQFDASVKNVGAEALHLGDVDYYLEGGSSELGDHHIFEYSACHEHYHFSHYGDFVLTAGQARRGNKQAFCLQSTNRYANHEQAPLTHPYGSCAYQGIQAGWGDDYGAGLECQWIDVTGLQQASSDEPPRLAFVSNPDRFLCEGSPVLDDEGRLTFEPSEFTTATGETVDRPVCDMMSGWDGNNEQTRAAPLPERGALITTPCTRGQLGPLRDCGFEEAAGALDVVDCPVGETLRLTCSVPEGEPPSVLRVCEYSHALESGVYCVYRDALVNTLVEGAEVQVEVTCPAARDDVEVGGRVSLYGAPLVPGAPSGLECLVD